MDAHGWNERYSGTDLFWSAGPSQWVQREAGPLLPGTALDLAAGEGRNAIWLAELGWHVTAVDFAQAGLDRGRARADEVARSLGRELEIEWVCEDVVQRPIPAGVYDLIVLAYLHLPEYDRREVVRRCAQALRPGGTLLVVGHDSSNLAEGYGGPQDPNLLFTAHDIEQDLRDQVATGDLVIDRSGRVAREVPDAGGAQVAWDALVRAHRRNVSRSEVTFG